MFRADVEVTDPGLIKAYEQLLEQAPDVVNAFVNRTVNRVGDKLLARFQQEPGPVVYSRDGKLAWKSDKQRKAFFATDGFGGGIPYQRRAAPNRMVDRWRLIITYEPNRLTSIALQNDDPVHQFVTGQFQQPFHAITGWYQEQVLFDQAQVQLTDEVETDLIKGFYSLEGR